MLSTSNEDEYCNELILNAHAGMLHDNYRHQAYQAAITNAVNTKKRQGDIVRVLDIGAGTGILSIFAWQAGADVVVACEGSKIMCSVAQDTFIKNNVENTTNRHPIILKNVFSNNLTLKNPEYKNYFNVIVSEVYDSHLIGEGCLRTFEHALQELAAPSCIFIPMSAAIYIQPFASESLRSFCIDHQNRFMKPVEPWETQVGKIKDIVAKPPLNVHTWMFNKGDISNWMFDKEVNVNWDGGTSCIGIIFWWESQLDNQSVISTVPSFSLMYQEFRDHWMPVVYFLPPKSSDFKLQARNDLFTIQFSCPHTIPQVENSIYHRHIAITNATLKHFITAITDLVDKKRSSFMIKYKGRTHLKDAVLQKLHHKVDDISFINSNSNTEYEIEILDCFDVFSLTQLEFYLKRREYERKVAGSDQVLIPSQTMLYVQLIESQQLYNKSIPPSRVEGVDISDYRDAVKRLTTNNLHGYDKLDPIYSWEYEYGELSSPILVNLENDVPITTLLIPVSTYGKLTNIFFSVGFKFGDESVRLLPGQYFVKIDSLLVSNCFSVEPGDAVAITLTFRDKILQDIAVQNTEANSHLS